MCVAVASFRIESSWKFIWNASWMWCRLGGILCLFCYFFSFFSKQREWNRSAHTVLLFTGFHTVLTLSDLFHWIFFSLCVIAMLIISAYNDTHMHAYRCIELRVKKNRIAKEILSDMVFHFRVQRFTLCNRGKNINKIRHRVHHVYVYCQQVVNRMCKCREYVCFGCCAS